MPVEEVGAHQDVAVHEDDQARSGRADPRVAGGAASPVGGEAHEPDAGRKRLRDARSLVGRPVIDDDDLIVIRRKRLIE